MAARGSDAPAGQAAEAFRREAKALERALTGEADASDDALRDCLDRLGDLFLAMTGRTPATAESEPDLPGSGGPR